MSGHGTTITVFGMHSVQTVRRLDTIRRMAVAVGTAQYVSRFFSFSFFFSVPYRFIVILSIHTFLPYVS